MAEAITKLEQETFDLLLLDLGLPESQGVETVERLRAISEDTPIVVLTDLADEVVALESLESGAQDYLCKSDLSTEALSRAIRYAMQRHQLDIIPGLALCHVHHQFDMLQKPGQSLEIGQRPDQLLEVLQPARRLDRADVGRG